MKNGDWVSQMLFLYLLKLLALIDHLLIINLFEYIYFLIFIVIQLQLYAFSPHPSAPPR